MRDARRRSLGRLRVAVVAPALVVLAACGSSERGSPSSLSPRSSPVSTEPSDTRAVATSATTASSTAERFALDEVVADFVGDRDGGVAVLVIRNGRTTTASAGVANSRGDPITPTTPFRVGSISKSFVATMVLQLVDEGRVELDKPLSTYLPDSAVGADVTIRALLSHRSGLPNYTDTGNLIDDALRDRSRHFTPDDILGYVEAVAAGEPDQRFAYSNTNYILLGQLIERLDGVDLNTALHGRITGALGLDVTRYATGDDPTPNGVAAGWSPGTLDGDPDAMYDSIASSAWAAGALVSNVDQLSTFLAALFAGELLSAHALTEMTTTGLEGYGLGLLAAGLGPNQHGYGHGGAIFGYTSIMAIDPETGDTIVITTNNDDLVADQLALRIIENW